MAASGSGDPVGTMGNLDETVFTDPLSAAERDALTRIRQHEEAVGPLRSAIADLRTKGKGSLAELRRVVELADTAEALIEVSQDVLAREAIAESEWPFADLVVARKLVKAASENDEAMEQARKQIDVKEQCTAQTLCQALEDLLCSWFSLQDAETEKRADLSLAASRVDMTMEQRSNAISPLCDALIDKAVAMHASLSQRSKTTGAVPPALGVLTERMQAIIGQEKMRQTLDQLHVEIPSHHIFKLTGSSKKPGAASKRAGASGSATKSSARGGSKESRESSKESKEEEQLEAPIEIPPPEEPGQGKEPKETPGGSRLQTPMSSSMRRLNFAGFAGSSAASPDPTAESLEPRSVKTPAPSPATAAIPESSEHSPVAKCNAAGPNANLERCESERGTLDCAKDVVDDPLSRTVPHAPQVATGGTDAPCSSGATAGVPGPAARPRVGGAPDLWKAVHVGDEAAISRMITSGLCDASLRDAAQHSVLWHSIAFGHMSIAGLMLDKFPPQSAGGVDVTESHHRTGDSFLHLLCQSKSFGMETASVFKRVALACPARVFQKVNNAGMTFLQLASASLNFWVLSFTLRNFQVHSKALVCMPANAPMRALAQAIPQPALRKYDEPEPLPDHFRVAELLEKDDSGTVPYADVAFDVGPDSGGMASARFLAHRIVVAGQSSVLFDQLEKLPLTPLPREGLNAAIVRVDPRISREVWRSCLKFMYTGIIECEFSQDVLKVVELLRAAVLYKLPRPLLDYSQSCLYPLLPASPPQISLQVFSICSGVTAADGELDSAKETSTYIILRGAHKLFESTEPKEACQLLERVVQTVERGVFRRARQEQQNQAPQQPQQQLQQQQQQQQQMAGGNPNAPVDALSQSFRRVQIPAVAPPGKGVPNYGQVPAAAAAANGQDMLSMSQSWRGPMPGSMQVPGGMPAAARQQVDYLSQSHSGMGAFPQNYGGAAAGRHAGYQCGVPPTPPAGGGCATPGYGGGMPPPSPGVYGGSVPPSPVPYGGCGTPGYGGWRQ